MTTEAGPEFHEVDQPLSPVEAALQVVHRRNMLTQLRGLGLRVGKAWAPEEIAKLGSTQEEMDLLGGMRDNVQYEEPYQSGVILGYSEFQLRWSGPPLSFLERFIRPIDQRTGGDVVSLVDTPVKYIQIRVQEPIRTEAEVAAGSRRRFMDDAMIFVVHGSPIVAVSHRLLDPGSGKLLAGDLDVGVEYPGLRNLLTPAPGETPESQIHFLDESTEAVLAEALITAREH